MYFCGNVITGYDIQVFCEIKSIQLVAEGFIREALMTNANVAKWMNFIESIPELRDLHERCD